MGMREAARSFTAFHIYSQVLILVCCWQSADCEKGRILLRTGHLTVTRDAFRSPNGGRLLREVAAAALHDQRWGPLVDAQQYFLTVRPGWPRTELPALFDNLKAHGCMVFSSIPEDTWRLMCPPAILEVAEKLPAVLWMGEVEAEQKLSPHWQHIGELAANQTTHLRLAQGVGVSTVWKELGAPIPHYVGKLHMLTDAGQEPLILIRVVFPHLQAAHLGDKPYNPAAAAAADWRLPLQQLYGSRCAARVHMDHGVLYVAVCGPNLPRVLSWLASQPAVVWLEPRMQSELHNLIASTILELGEPAQRTSPTDPASHPLWQRGLDGTGQVVGAGDSGLDYNSCWFKDDGVDVASNFRTDTRMDATGSVFNSTTHRKIRLYVAKRDSVDDSGHGTHISGTLAGHQVTGEETDDYYVGHAPGAKIAFIDLSNGAGSDGISTPGDLDASYFPDAYSVGARVHSDSWGAAARTYESLAISVDRFLWHHQDFVSVFAAGNYGLTGDKTTVTSPATAKNCIAVAAGLSTLDPSPARRVTVYQMSTGVALLGGTEERSVKVLEGTIGRGRFSSMGGLFTVQGASPDNGCTGLTTLVQGSVVLIRRDTCPFATKLRNAQYAGAAAVIITNTLDDGYFKVDSVDDGTTGNDLSIPIGVIPKAYGEYLWARIRAGYRVTATFSAASLSQMNYDNMASFSSYGPTDDGRIKPDLAAPGVAYSSWPGPPGTCTHKQLQGTSMATPATAASAILARQYFMNGYYPTRAANPAHSYEPSGVLLKALLIAGARAMEGTTELTSLPLQEPPSFLQGFGRVDLSRALPLAELPGFKLQVVDLASLQEGSSHQYCVQALGGPLSVALVWYDFPGDDNAAVALVNDLDLAVRVAGLQGATLYPNNLQQADRVNTVERVYMATVPAGNVAIDVRAYRVNPAISPTQNYSLVVLGDFNGILASPRNPASNSNTTGVCVITLAVIRRDLSASALSTNKNPEFTFTTPSGTLPIEGFECQLLRSTGGDSVTVIQAWAGCSQNSCTDRLCTTSFQDLLDGTYIFMVRSKGDDLGDTLEFTVDANPPVTTLATSLTAPADANGVVATSTDNITFTFTAVDLTAVTFTCTIRMPDNPSLRTSVRVPGQGGAEIGASVGTGVQPLDSPFVCTSPVNVLGLTYGSWSFDVRGQDAAGNVETSIRRVSWNTRYQPGLVYTRIQSGPYGLVNNATLSFGLAALSTSTPEEAPIEDASAQFQYALVPAQSDVQQPVSWLEFPASASVVAPADGEYTFFATVLGAADTGNDTMAVVPVVVDTTPPNITYIQAPPPPPGVYTTPTVVLRFNTSADAILFKCRWMYSPVSSPDSNAVNPAFGACDRTTTDTISHDVTDDGFYLFQMTAEDQAGNIGQAPDVLFRVDSHPPMLLDIAMPNATRSNRLDIALKLSDGPLGVGLANVSCRMQTKIGVGSYPEGDGYKKPPEDWEPNCGGPDGTLVQRKYAVPEGRFSFSIMATDLGGLQTDRNWVIIVDKQPPVTAMATSKTLFPSTVVMEFVTRDRPDSPNSGVAPNGTECQLNPLVGPLPDLSGANNIQRPLAPPPPRRPPSPPKPPAPPPMPPISPPPPPPIIIGRRALQSDGLAANPRFTDNTIVPFGAWFDCTSPLTMMNFSSGNYTFIARATDTAGNLGNQTDPFYFQVDETLGQTKANSADSNRLSWRWQWVAIAASAGGAAVLIVAVVSIAMYCRRRAFVKRQQARQQRTNIYSAQGQGSPTQYYGPPMAQRYNASTPQLVAALQATGFTSQAQLDAHVQAQRRAREEEQMRKAYTASREEENMRRAIAASMAYGGDGAKVPLPGGWQTPDDVRMQKAIELSKREVSEKEALSLAMEMSIQSALEAERRRQGSWSAPGPDTPGNATPTAPTHRSPAASPSRATTPTGLEGGASTSSASELRPLPRTTQDSMGSADGSKGTTLPMPPPQ